MPFVRANSINIYYEIHGAGEPLVLISGLGGDRTFWQASIPILTLHFQVIIFDTRGIGRTDAPKEKYSMEIFAADLEGLMDALQIQKAYVLGYSMGGQIAMTFALKYPSRVSKLIIAASCAKLNTQIRLYVDAVLSVYEGGANPRQMFELVAPWLFSAAFLSNTENENYLQFDENDPEQQPLYAWKNQYLAQREFDITDQLKDITAPTLILSGEADVFANAADNEVLAQRIPDAVHHELRGAGHLFNYEIPELFHKYVLNFYQ